MRGWGLAAFPLALPLLTCACGGESRPDSPHTVHPFDDQGRGHPPRGGF